MLLLGATGLIGSAILRELTGSGYRVAALARTDDAAERLKGLGATVVRGDLREPGGWARTVRDVGAVIHAAATFDADMGAVDRRVLDALAGARAPGRPVRLIYTGGCWLYGETGDTIADEDRPFDPIAAFGWMAGNAAFALQHPSFATSVVHPAITYGKRGDAFERFRAPAARGEPVPVWGAPTIRWPLVHRDDLARAYRLVLEGGEVGRHYCVAAEAGVEVGRIAHAVAAPAVAERARPNASALAIIPRERVLAIEGAWAEGPMLDQRMASARIARELGWKPRHTDALGWIRRGGAPDRTD